MRAIVIGMGCVMVTGVPALPALGQIQRPGIGASSPNALNQSQQLAQQLRLMDEQHRADEWRQQHDPATRFLEAVKPRKRHYRDFDQVVLRGNTPMTADVLGLMAQSPYAADLAYYLAKHPDEALAVTQMEPAQASDALRRLEATVSGGASGSK